VPPRGQSSRCRTVSDCRAVSACPFAEGDVREAFGVALASVDVSEDDQRQRLLNIVVAVHPLRDGLADPVGRTQPSLRRWSRDCRSGQVELLESQ
jgi:hypothetical protein